MAKDLIKAVLVTDAAVEWIVAQPGKTGFEVVSDGAVAIDLLDEACGENSGLSEKGVPLTLALPSDRLLLRVIDLPAVEDEEDLRGMVELQLDKFSPFPIEQMVISYEVLARNDDNIKVLVAAAREQTVSDSAAVLEKCGVEAADIKRVDAEVLGIWRNLHENGLLDEEGRALLVLVKDGVVDLIVHESGALLGISCLGKVDGLENAEIANEIAGELTNLLLTMEFSQGGRWDGPVTVWGGGGLNHFTAALSRECGGSVHERYFEDMPSATYGAVTRTLQGGGLLDLTLDSWRLSASAKRDRRRLLGLSVIILCVWGVLVGSGLGWIELEKMRLGRLKKEDEELAGPANKVRKLRLQASMIERYTDRTYSALECLREISRLLPDGVDLTSFSYRKGESIDIGGEADSGTLVNRFNEALNQSKLFGDVKSGAHTLTKKGRRRFSFDIKFPENK